MVTLNPESPNNYAHRPLNPKPKTDTNRDTHTHKDTTTTFWCMPEVLNDDYQTKGYQFKVLDFEGQLVDW